MNFAFSYSRWSVWSKCPAAYKFKHIDKLPEPGSPALVKGRKVHDDLAKYIAGASDERPEAAKNFTCLVDGLREAKVAQPKAVHVELQYAVDRDLRPVTWFGKNVWFRAAWDVLVESGPAVDAVDWKTGRPYGSYEDQKQLFAVAAFWRNPALEQFTGHWAYLDTRDDPHVAVYTREQAGPLTEVWRGNAAMMESDRAFKAKPSQDACKFCNFSWRKDGPCKEGV
jgi:hypothetical protein